jgi:hypothetical protein
MAPSETDYDLPDRRAEAMELSRDELVDAYVYLYQKWDEATADRSKDGSQQDYAGSLARKYERNRWYWIAFLSLVAFALQVMFTLPVATIGALLMCGYALAKAQE